MAYQRGFKSAANNLATEVRADLEIGPFDCHELSHGLLQHPRTPALDDTGCRFWNQDIEDEANWLSGCLLVPEVAALEIARGRWTIAEAARRFGVSQKMIQYRLNATGAAKRVYCAASKAHW